MSLRFATNPIDLRYRFEKSKPFAIDAPIIIRSENQLDRLPFDIWQQGHRITLGLNNFFPNLAYPVLQQLAPNQIWRLGQYPLPLTKLGNKGSIEFILKYVFELDLSMSVSSDDLVIWLNKYHQSLDKLPKIFSNYILNTLGKVQDIKNLNELLEDKESFIDFLQEQWSRYILREEGGSMIDYDATYILDFENHIRLQDQLSTFIRSGNLAPVKVVSPDKIPFWAKSGVLTSDEDPNQVRLDELTQILGELSDQELGEYRWEEWQALAYILAEFTALIVTTKQDSESFEKDIQIKCDKKLSQKAF
jgi:hypothetical protein